MTSSRPRRDGERPESRARPVASGRWPTLAAILVLAVAARHWTDQHLPLLGTDDSSEYLGLARRIAVGDWSSPALGGVRSPGYPVFLALLHRTFGLNSSTLLAAQHSVGVLSSLLLAACGHCLAGRKGAFLLGGVGALHPALLLFEHQVMAESLFGASLVGLATVTLAAHQRGFRFPGGLAVGLALSASLLVRANGILLAAALGAVGLLDLAIRGGPRRIQDRFQPLLRYSAGLLVGSAALLAPWLWRMNEMFGEPLLTGFRSAPLAYIAQYGLLRDDLPLWRSLGSPYRSVEPGSIWAALWLLRPNPKQRTENKSGDLIFRSGFEHPGLDLQSRWDADSVPPTTSHGNQDKPQIRELIAEQVAAQPAGFRAARLHATASFFGFTAPFGGPAPGQGDVAFWFRHIVADTGSTPTHTMRSLERRLPGASMSSPRVGSRAWSRVGQFYLMWLRPLLVASVLLLPVALFVRGQRLTDPLGWFLLAGLILTALLHGYMLAGYDRFALPFDPLFGLAAVALLYGRDR